MEDLERHVASESTAIARWTNVNVVPQASEAADTPAESRLKWGKIYRLFGASGESAQDEVFAALNLYFLTNGCSPYGKYKKPVRTAGGTEVEAGMVVKIIGSTEGAIRQFMRGRLHDSYMFLKYNRQVREIEDIATRAENAGIPREQCWLFADWFGKDCPHFVGDESYLYTSLRTSKIAAAVNKRVTSLAPADKVMAMTPEAKVSDGVRHEARGSFNNDLF